MSGFQRLLKIRIIAVGAAKDSWVAGGCNHYLKLLSRFSQPELIIVRSETGARSLPPEQIKKRESSGLLARVKKGMLVALHDGGTKYDSQSFARQFEKWHTQSAGCINFFIGGAYGLDAAIIDKADSILSLSMMTVSHQLVRVVLLEQLYRAFSILHGTDYHK